MFNVRRLTFAASVRGHGLEPRFRRSERRVLPLDDPRRIINIVLIYLLYLRNYILPFRID